MTDPNPKPDIIPPIGPSDTGIDPDPRIEDGITPPFDDPDGDVAPVDDPVRDTVGDPVDNDIPTRPPVEDIPVEDV
ncbi:hypothetical protein IFT84_06560 [Rhizobium sp. CFBP 8762]|uniref:hypothetical protein n=1 Tax=Rhizobium sp. CFBP 8762 TaxID=2775279 RepID=UPI00177CAB16|nr:hypothetical protein [Rhizobium sp. CFBP 8762]MBD8554185.1 hypothetical protein [Rhizobium sp. CFBP 8762]